MFVRSVCAINQPAIMQAAEAKQGGFFFIDLVC